MLFYKNSQWIKFSIRLGWYVQMHINGGWIEESSTPIKSLWRFVILDILEKLPQIRKKNETRWNNVDRSNNDRCLQ